MTGNTGSAGSGNNPELDHHDYLTLWLSYESKIEELRNRFFTIAGLLFTLQSGIFALMLDKIFLSDKPLQPLLALQAERCLKRLSVLILLFFILISFTYIHHIKRNVHRSEVVVAQSGYIQVKIKNVVDGVETPNKLQEFIRALSFQGGIYTVCVIYLILFLTTVGM
jgi:hypothetical protein